MNKEKATFGAGCFWGVEDVFSKVEGVLETSVGYTGGHTENPTYEDVCSHSTGHAEVVQLCFDPEIISYKKLLEIFFSIHDPTTLNRQGPDIGDQYRSVIYYHSEEQNKLAHAAKEFFNSSGDFNRPIVTEISRAPTYYRAEEYHQKYFQKHSVPSCHLPPR